MQWLVVFGWVSVIFALSSILSLHGPFLPFVAFLLKALAHIGEYAVLTALLWWGLQRYRGSRMPVWPLAVLMAGIYALSDAWRQSSNAGEQSAFRAVGIDALGIVGSYALVHYLPSRAPALFKGKPSPGPCPACQGTRVYRSRRRGLWERHSRLIRLTPYRCDTCGHRYWRFRR
jgi:hypothetical protein